ncbi:MAG TPA: hypothetical protein VNP04_30525 [Alphaproteobacteria bacterium]|nr:hypothetical protein [Alphaproteobacteria bacterium]
MPERLPPGRKAAGDGVGGRTPEVERGASLWQPSMVERTAPHGAHNMRTIRHAIAHAMPPVGIGLTLAGLFGGPALPAASPADVELFVCQNDRVVRRPSGYDQPWGGYDDGSRRDPWRQQSHWSQRYPWGWPGPWGYRHDRPSRRSGYGLPDRYTIHRGKKCELRCERIRGTRDYRCREYRC